MTGTISTQVQVDVYRRAAQQIAPMYTFKSKTTADLLMFKATGDELLRLMGHEPSATGIVQASELAAALAMLEQAVAADERPQVPSPKPDSKPDQADDAGEVPEPTVGLRQRAWPLMEMMKRALAEGVAIVWGV
jgi:hypothetical protein